MIPVREPRLIGTNEGQTRVGVLYPAQHGLAVMENLKILRTRQDGDTTIYMNTVVFLLYIL